MPETAQWLRTGFSDGTGTVHDDNDLVVGHANMSGRQTGPFVAYLPPGSRPQRGELTCS